MEDTIDDVDEDPTYVVVGPYEDDVYEDWCMELDEVE